MGALRALHPVSKIVLVVKSRVIIGNGNSISSLDLLTTQAVLLAVGSDTDTEVGGNTLPPLLPWKLP